MNTTYSKRCVKPALKRATVTLSCLFATLACGAGFAAEPEAPERGQLLSAPGASLEANVGTKALLNPDEPALTAGAPAPAGIAGKLFRMSDRPSSPQAQSLQPPRTVFHDDRPQHQSAVDVTGAARFRKAPSSPRSAPPAAALTKTPGDSVRKFDGPTSGWTPPDMGIAAGPSHVVTTINSGLAIHTKLGTQVQGYTTFENIIPSSDKPSNWAGFMFDPRIIYDSVRNKFVVLVSGKDETNEEAHFWILVSESSDPTDGWCPYYFDATVFDGNRAAFLDFAGLGVDNWGVYVTGDYKFFDGGFHASNIWTINPDIMNGCSGSQNGWRFLNVQWPGGGDAKSFAPAHPHTINSEEETFFVASHTSSGDKVVLAKISGDRTSFPTLTRAEIDVPAYNAIDLNVDQPGSTADIDGKTSKVQNAVYVNRRVFFALTDDVNNDGSASGWLTVKLDTNTNTKEWHHLLWGGEGYYYMFPAVTVQGYRDDNNVAVFGSWTDAETTVSAGTQFPSGLYKLYENQPTDHLGRFTSVKAGEGPYSSASMRFGDYSGAAYDWSCDHAWGLVEWSDANGNWKTTINARNFENETDCPLIEFSDPVPAQVLTSGTNHTIRWNSADLPATDEIIIYVFAEGFVQQVATLPSTATSFSWFVPELDTSNALLSIGSWTGSEYSALAWTEEFTIVDATPPSPDPLGWDLAPRPLGNGELEMAVESANDGTGSVEYQLDYQSSPTGGSGATDSGWMIGNTYEDSGLGSNHEYCYRGRARDEHGNATGYSSTLCAVTLARKPEPLTFGAITDYSVVATWASAGNSSTTEYQVENVTRGTNSGAVSALQWKETGLTPGMTYRYRVRARNSDGITTEWADLGSATTLFIDPDGDAVSAAMDNCLNVANTDQRDSDEDGLGNACDGDFNNDCNINFVDLGIMKDVMFTGDHDADLDGNGSVNFLDVGILKSMFSSGRDQAESLICATFN